MVQVAAEKWKCRCARSQADVLAEGTAAAPARRFRRPRRYAYARARLPRNSATSYDRLPQPAAHALPAAADSRLIRFRHTCAVSCPQHGAIRFPPCLAREALTRSTRHRGRGIASINYPIGMNLGGDRAKRWCIPIRAQVHGVAVLDRSRPGHEVGDPGRSAAETLGVPVEDVYVDTADSDTGRTAWATSPRAARIALATQ